MTSEATAVRVFTYLSDDILSGKDVLPGHRGFELQLPGIGELSARVKVYVEGGENVMHSHPREDHMFFVLSGSATFRIESDDNTVDVAANDAISVPQGTKYWFTNTGAGNLVILRIGNGSDPNYRLDAEGVEFPPISAAPTHASWRQDAGRAVG